MDGAEAVLLVGAGLAAGGVNAVAGGGSLVSFPALLALGLPPLTANVTNSVAVWPGYVGTCWGYRAELRERARRLLRLVPAAVAGAVLGCLLLLVSDEDVFARVVPYLVLLGALLLAVQERLTERVRSWRGSDRGDRSPALHVGLVVAAAYGAYFGGGLGVVLLACLGLLVADDLQHHNGAQERAVAGRQRRRARRLRAVRTGRLGGGRGARTGRAGRRVPRCARRAAAAGARAAHGGRRARGRGRARAAVTRTHREDRSTEALGRARIIRNPAVTPAADDLEEP